MPVSTKLKRTEALLDESIVALTSVHHLLCDAIDICNAYHELVDGVVSYTGDADLKKALDEARKPLELTAALSTEAAGQIENLAKMVKAVRQQPNNIVTIN